MLSGANAKVSDVPAQPATVVDERMRVQVLDVTAQQIPREIVLQGQLEPSRQVEIRVQTGSKVVALPVDKRARVEADAVLIELAEQNRRAAS